LKNLDKLLAGLAEKAAVIIAVGSLLKTFNKLMFRNHRLFSLNNNAFIAKRGKINCLRHLDG